MSVIASSGRAGLMGPGHIKRIDDLETFRSLVKIAAYNPVGVSAIDIPLPDGHEEFLLIARGLSHNAGTSALLRLATSANGVTFDTPVSIDTMTSAAVVGSISLNLISPRVASATVAMSGVSVMGSAVANIAPVALGTTNATHARLLITVGAFDAGLITLYGVKS